jgi:hypothetical protein
LRKQSYVRLDNVYETNISSLRSYNLEIELPAYHWRLDEKSYHKLMSLLLLEAQDYPPTDSVKSIRKARNARIPICAPGPTVAQNLRNTRIPICALGTTATQDQGNAYTPHRLSSEPVLKMPAPRIRTHQIHHSPAYVNYGSIMQLPPPTTHTQRHHQSSWSSRSIMTFFVCLLCLLFFYVVYRLWYEFFRSA